MVSNQTMHKSATTKKIIIMYSKSNNDAEFRHVHVKIVFLQVKITHIHDSNYIKPWNITKNFHNHLK